MSFNFSGYQIIEDAGLVNRVQIRFPKSRRRRIRKKWAGRESSFRVTLQREFLVSERPPMIVGHPVMIAELKRAAANPPPGRARG